MKSTCSRSAAVGFRDFFFCYCGAPVFLGYVPLSPSPLRTQEERERGKDGPDEERVRVLGEGERKTGSGLAALARGYSLCCDGNSREEAGHKWRRKRRRAQ